MNPWGSMIKPEPSEVTWRGFSPSGPRKFLNRSSSGDPGGTFGSAALGGAFSVWEVAILTTVGSSLEARSAKESGAGRAAAGLRPSARRADTANTNRILIVPGREHGPRRLKSGFGVQHTSKDAFRQDFEPCPGRFDGGSTLALSFATPYRSRT